MPKKSQINEYSDKCLNHNCFCQMPKSSSKVLFKLDFPHDDALRCCLRYSNIEYQDEILKTSHLKVLLKR